jgi:hypothetical protein
MRFKHPALDRVWLCLIALALVVMAPIWFLIMVERFGWRSTVGGVLLALFIRWQLGQREQQSRE